MSSAWEEVAGGGVTSAPGFRAATVAAGIRYQRDDLALLVSDEPALAAGLFTSNRVQAAPVKYCRARLEPGQPVRAILVNSGNANACTGEAGRRAVAQSADAVAAALGCAPEAVLVCSTGTIGVPLPVDKITSAIPLLPARLSPDGGTAAAQAILTTDTRAKTVALRAVIAGVPVTVGGMAKGAGMIEPHLATLLAFVTTDAVVTDPAVLRMALVAAAEASFNRVTIDGDQSTNDSLLLLANGRAGHPALSPGAPGWDVFTAMLTEVCRRLAYAVVADGEGATRVVEIRVRGAADDADAEKAARAVGRSMLVKTSWNGADPNWGRVMDALGYSGADLREETVAIDFDDVPAVRDGCSAGTAPQALQKVMRQPAFCLGIDLGIGRGEYALWSCDCSEEYVRINAAYMT